MWHKQIYFLIKSQVKKYIPEEWFFPPSWNTVNLWYTGHHRYVTSPPFNPLWLIQWLFVAGKRSAARKQSTQLTVAARATREMSRKRDASVAAAAEIARVRRRSECRLELRGHRRQRCIRKDGGHHPERKGARRGGRITLRGPKRVESHAGTVWFAACRSVDCSPIAPRHRRHQPGTVSPYTGCAAKVRIKLGKRRFYYDKFAQDRP